MKVLIAGIGRNIENSIPFLKVTFESIADVVEDCSVAIYENNSTDLSPELLRSWSEEESRVDTICEKIPIEDQLYRGKARTWDNKPCRLEIIADARNRLLQMIRNPKYSTFDLVLMIDLDIPQPLPINETLNAIETFPADAAAVFSYGVNSVGKMYDMHPYRDSDIPFGPEILGDDFFSIPNQKRFFRHTSNLKQYDFYPVYSAFNGAGLYHRDLLVSCSYSAAPTKELDDFYRLQADRLGKTPTNWFPGDTHIGSTLQGVYLFGAESFFYRNNSGYNFPVTIAHSTLHATLQNKGNLYLRPSWVHQSHHPGYYFWDEIIQRKIRQIHSRIIN